MKELKTYISEGFFSNVGANNIIKPVIDAIKDASMNNKIDSDSKRFEFAILLTSILKDIETNIKKGKFIFKYTKNDLSNHMNVTISLEMTGLNNAKWTYSSSASKYGWSADDIARRIARDLDDEEGACLLMGPRFRHSIANTIEVTEFKVS